jgi:hypothetical protein
MKKLIVSLCSLLIITSAVTAQSLHLGARAGANLGKIDGKSFKEEYNLGYLLGAYVELGLNKNIGIQPELLFTQSNPRIDSGYKAIYQNVPDAVIGDKAHLNYLTIPILLNIHAGNLLTLQLGPQFSILMNKDQSLVQNGTNAVKNGDFSALLGAQVNLGALNVFGRYAIGLNNLNDIDDRDKWKSQQIQLGIGYRIF